MRNVTTICVCLPADMAERLRADAKRLGVSVSSYVKMMLAVSDSYHHGKTHAAPPYGMPLDEVYAETDSVKVVNDNGSTD